MRKRRIGEVMADLQALPRRRTKEGFPNTGPLVIERLRIEEGVLDYPYDDATGVKVSAPIGVITWGVGFTWPMGDEVIDTVLALKRSRHTAELEEMLQRELDLDNVYAWYALPVQVYAALEDLAYNLGVPRLTKFRKTLGYLKQERWENAAAELLDSRYARQVPKRAERNAALIRGKD